jgi:poly(A) polymerase
VRQKFIRLALEDTDRRVAEGRSVVPSFLLACLLWHDVQVRWSALRAAGEGAFPALQQAVDTVFDARIGDISGRGKLAADMREIWQMQPRFERRTLASVPALVEQPRYRAGYDFLRLRADVGEVPAELADWWEDYALGSDEEREALLAELRLAQTRRVAGGRGGGGGKGTQAVSDAPPAAASAGAASRVASSGQGAAPDAAGSAGSPSADGDEHTVGETGERRRRRRRRRTPRQDDAAAPDMPERA